MPLRQGMGDGGSFIGISTYIVTMPTWGNQACLQASVVSMKPATPPLFPVQASFLPCCQAVQASAQSKCPQLAATAGDPPTSSSMRRCRASCACRSSSLAVTTVLGPHTLRRLQAGQVLESGFSACPCRQHRTQLLEPPEKGNAMHLARAHCTTVTLSQLLALHFLQCPLRGEADTPRHQP